MSMEHNNDIIRVDGMTPSAGNHDLFLPAKKNYRKIAGIVFLAALLILIFFSKTIYNYNLPVITAVKPENGRLSKLEISTGISDWADVENIYFELGGKVEEVLVKEGDTVRLGQELFRLSFDRDEAGRRLREIQNSRSRINTDIQNINLKLERQTRYMNELAGESYDKEIVSSYELDALAIDIRKAREELNDARERYDDGNADELEVDRARFNLQSLYLKQEEAERKLDEQRRKAKESYEQKKSDREAKLKDYEADIVALRLDLQSKNIELNSLSIQEEPYKKALEDFASFESVTAPVSGTVISMDAGKGETVRDAQFAASIGVGSRFEVKCDISLDNNFVIPGDVVELSNTSRVVEGTVSGVKPSARGKTVTIEIISDEITPGETFDATFQKDSTTTYTLVPNGALNQDNDGYFLNQVKKRDGIMGQEYYLERLDVYIGDSDSKNTAIVRGVTFFEPVALISDKPVTAGDVVFLSNAGDFFEK